MYGFGLMHGLGNGYKLPDSRVLPHYYAVNGVCTCLEHHGT